MHRANGTGGYGSTGWSLGLNEKYRAGPNSSGELAVDNITAGNRSVRFSNNLDLGERGRVSTAINYYRYSPDYPGALTGRAVYSRRLQGMDLDVIGIGSSVGGVTSSSLDANARWGDREIGHTGVNYDVTGNLGYGTGQGTYGGGFCVGGGVGLAPPTWQITGHTSAGLEVAQQYVWAQVGGGSMTTDVRSTLRQTVGRLGSLGLTYSYNLQHGGYYNSYGTQQLSFNGYLSGGAIWNANGYATYDLTRGSIFSSGGISYRLPFSEGAGRLPWRLDLRGSYTRFGTGRTVSSRVAIGRALGQYEVLMCYSPTANYGFGSYGYGSSSGKRFWIELGGLAF